MTHKKTGKKLYGKIDVSITDPKDLEKAAQQSEALKGAVQQIIKELKQRGISSGGMLDFIDKITKVKIPFEEHMRHMMNQVMRPDPNTRCWRNINKKMAAVGYEFPGTDQIMEGSKLLIGVDTSGSMGKDDLAIAGGVIQEGLSSYNTLTIIHHDFNIQKKIDTEVDEVDEVSLIHEFKGRGGTSHVEIFDEIEKIKEEVGLVILISDFFSDISKTMLKKYKWIEEVPVIALSTPSYDSGQVETLVENVKNCVHLTTEDAVVE